MYEAYDVPGMVKDRIDDIRRDEEQARMVRMALRAQGVRGWWWFHAFKAWVRSFVALFNSIDPDVTIDDDQHDWTQRRSYA